MPKILAFIAVTSLMAFAPPLNNAAGAVDTPFNDPPDLQDIDPQFVTILASFSLTLVATDPDQDQTLIFSAIGLPSWANIDASTGTVTGTPTEADGGTVSFVTATVRDNGDPQLSDLETLILVVNEVPAPSTVNDEVAEPEDTPVTGSVLVDDTSPDSSPTIIDVLIPSFGIAVANQDKVITYTPAFFGLSSDTFVYIADTERSLWEMILNIGNGE
jgi:hypothetical protein